MKTAIKGQYTPQNKKYNQIFFGRTYFSEVDAEDTFEELKNNNVSTIWNLQKEESLINLEKLNFNVLHTPIKDYDVPSNLSSFKRDVGDILHFLTEGSVYVHCYGGCGRTGTALACLIKTIEGITSEEALSIVKDLCHGPELEEQEEFVKNF